MERRLKSCVKKNNMQNEQNKIIEALENHFSKKRVSFNFNQIMPKRIAYILIRDVTMEECPLLSRNFSKSEIVYFFPDMEIVDMELARIKHLNYQNPYDFLYFPDDALLQLAFNN
jgi:hypothetical protein